jgi:hypothetical protein
MGQDKEIVSRQMNLIFLFRFSDGLAETGKRYRFNSVCLELEEKVNQLEYRKFGV